MVDSYNYSTSTNTDKTRTVYNFSTAIVVNEHRITSLDAFDNVVVLGNQKGYVTPYEQRFDPKAGN